MKKTKKSVSLFIAVILTICTISVLFSGCGASQKLTVKVDVSKQTFQFVDASGSALKYTTLMMDGQEVVKTTVTLSMGGGVHLATSDDQATTGDGTNTLNGGRVIQNGSEWGYTLKDGVLNILVGK